MITLFLIIGPICFVVVMGVAYFFMSGYNWVSRKCYERKIRKLEAREKELIRELEELTGKKYN